MIFEYKGIRPRIGKNVFIAENATVIGDVTLEDNVNIWFGTVIRGDVNYIRIGKNTNIQDCCVVHVDHGKYSTIVEENVTVGHGVVLHACTVRRCSLIGMNATVLDGAEVGPYSIVGAGCLVPPGMKIPEGKLVLGVPAKIVRDLTSEERKNLEESAMRYVEYAAQYMR